MAPATENTDFQRGICKDSGARHENHMVTEPHDLPPELVEGLLRFRQGDFSFRLPRSGKRDQADTAALFVNTIAEELQQILQKSQQQEKRLADIVERLSSTLIRVASGDFSAQVERDFVGDPPDVLAYLVNNTVVELGTLVTASRRRAEEDVHRLEELVRERTRELDRLATTDMLTQAHNRRRMDELGLQEIERARRYHQPLCLALLDLDHFKLINDTFGHIMGDEVLRRIAETVRGRVRVLDHVGRYGGEEFVVLAPNTPIAGGIKLGESVREAVGDIQLNDGEIRIHVTVSVGVAQWQENETMGDLFRRADSALYQAKKEGRNRVVAG